MAVRIILVGTTHPGNIGATARAMKNMGLEDLVLVNPRSFPHEDATARASGAEDILAKTVVVNDLDQALADCVFAAGASARSRTIDWPSLPPRECAELLVEKCAGGNVAVVFGPEKTGRKERKIKQKNRRGGGERLHTLCCMCFVCVCRKSLP